MVVKIAFIWCCLLISFGISVGKSSMVRSIVGCGTLLGVVLVGELVVGCV